MGLATGGAAREIEQLGTLLTGAGHLGLVHGDACPDNVRLPGDGCQIFDFDHAAAPAAGLAEQLHRPGRRGRRPPRLRALPVSCTTSFPRRWPGLVIPGYPALARPGPALARVPGWWQPGL